MDRTGKKELFGSTAATLSVISGNIFSGQFQFDKYLSQPALWAKAKM